MPEYLYKFRSFENLEFVLDILLNERLYCSLYKSLNDPFEGMFVSIINSFRQTRPGRPRPLFMRPTKEKQYKTVDDLPIDLSATRVCSLSSDSSDVRLWSHYADSHKGLAIQIEFSGTNSILHEVVYSENLPEFEGKNARSLEIVDILTRKTNHWIYESEYRIISEKEYFSIKDRITAIWLGPRVEDNRKDIILKIVSGKVPIHSTKVDHEKLRIVKDQKLN